MNILYIITSGDMGGAQYYVLKLAQAFKGSIVTGAEKDELVASANKLGIKTYQLPSLKRAISPWYDCWALFDLVRLVKQLKPDIIHLNSSKAGFIGSLIKIFVPKVIIVYTAHGFVFNEPGSKLKTVFYTFMEKLASRFRDYIIAVSEADRQSALKKHIINPNKISVIYNGLSAIPFVSKAVARQELGLPGQGFIAGTLSNHYHTKGLDILIQAVSQLSNTEVHFAVIGQGPIQNQLETQINNLHLNDRILLLGHKKAASTYLAAFDMFIMPSRKEGFPFAILEAMQAGLPIIASNVGGIPEALSDAGILVPPQDPAALAQAIKHLITNPGIAAKLSIKAHERARMFTLDEMTKRINTVYEQLLKIV